MKRFLLTLLLLLPHGLLIAETPGFRSTVQDMARPETPTLTVKMINDSMGIGIIEDWDDFYTFGAGIRYSASAWSAVFDYTALTDRGSPGLQPLRIDELSLRGGCRPFEGLTLYAEGNLYGAFGGEFVQNNWHRLLGIPRMGPYGYETWNGADFSIGAGYAGILFDGSGAFPGIGITCDAGTGILSPWRLQGALMLFWGNETDGFSLLAGYRTEHVGRPARVLESIAGMNSGWWLSFSFASGPLAVINSCDPETGSLDYSIELGVLSGGPSEGPDAGNRPGRLLRAGLGPFLDRIALDTVLLLPPVRGFAEERLSFGFTWQDGNERKLLTNGNTVHFQRFFALAEWAFFTPGERTWFLPVLRGGIGFEHRITAPSTMHRIVSETETVFPSLQAGAGMRISLPEGLPGFLPEELELTGNLHVTMTDAGIGADISPRFLFYFH